MVFGLFARKSALDDTSASPDTKTNDQSIRLPTPTPSIPSVSRHSPLRFSASLRGALGGSTTDLTLKDTDLATNIVALGANYAHSAAPLPSTTSSPPPAVPDDTKVLYDLMLTIPAKTLHAYTLSHLRPRLSPLSASASALESHPDVMPRPPSPSTLAKLTTFFSTLAPPPLLHCVRCHKDFYDIENEEKDKACRVPHDDESALVSRISGGGYETLWGCCGQTASGDGSEGPPDGWCYEGRHTVDIKRARFRADSTIHEDKLTSCLKLNCHGIRSKLPRSHSPPSRNIGTSSARKSNPSPVRSRASVVITRKRPRKSLKEASGSENEADAESVVDRKGGSGAHKVSDMVVDADKLNSSSKPKIKTKSRPISRARPPPSTSTSVSFLVSRTNATTVVSTKSKTIAAKPKSTSSRTLLSQSHTHLASDSEASTISRPRTRSHAREESRARDASRIRLTSKLTRANTSERQRRCKKVAKPLSESPTSEGEAEDGSNEYRESDTEERGRNRKKRRVGRA